MQTTSIELRTSEKNSYSFRTLDKDQSRVIDGILSYSALRPLLRDQTSALNPYGSPVVATLMDELGLWHTNPKIFAIPYTNDLDDSIKYHISGDIVLMEEEPGSKWKNNAVFGWPIDIVNTSEMFELGSKDNYKLDTLQYLKCRLFDILISDWDRHEGQWKWLLKKEGNHIKIEPLPIDRDMAFCRFDDGFINTFIVSATNKFKSFRGSKESLLDGAKKVTDIDKVLLSQIKESDYLAVSKEIKGSMTSDVINESFQLYPHEIFSLIGQDHINTLEERLEHLDKAAVEFRENILQE